MRILVADDEPAVREALERVLRLEGFEVALARDGREAVRTQTALPADAVLLDVLMPQLDGLEVCRRLRDTGDRTPVLMLTARDAIADRVDGLDAGADDYLTKPFGPGELAARVRAQLRGFDASEDAAPAIGTAAGTAARRGRRASGWGRRRRAPRAARRSRRCASRRRRRCRCSRVRSEQTWGTALNIFDTHF